MSQMYRHVIAENTHELDVTPFDLKGQVMHRGKRGKNNKFLAYDHNISFVNVKEGMKYHFIS